MSLSILFCIEARIVHPHTLHIPPFHHSPSFTTPPTIAHHIVHIPHHALTSRLASSERANVPYCLFQRTYNILMHLFPLSEYKFELVFLSLFFVFALCILHPSFIVFLFFEVSSITYSFRRLYTFQSTPSMFVVHAMVMVHGSWLRIWSWLRTSDKYFV